MSQDRLPQIQFFIRGLKEIILVGKELPEIPMEAIMPLVHELRNIGVDAAKAVLEQTATSEKSTGKTAELMMGIVEQIKFPDEWEISIGPDTRGMGKDEEYPKFVELGSGGGVTIGKNVQLLPYPLRWGYNALGKWRFIGVRKPEIVGHKWMEGAADAILGQTGRLYGKEVYRLTGVLDRKKNQINLSGDVTE